MDNSILGKTSLEQIPPEFNSERHRGRTPWAAIITVVVILIFGAFWYMNRTVVSQPITPVQSANIHSQSPVPMAEETNAEGLGDLQAAAVNTAIPDFGKNF